MEGNFDFLSSVSERNIMSNAFNKITELDLWSFFDIDPPQDLGYIFWENDDLKKIASALDSDGHSGASFAHVMRHMQFIRKEGWNAYVKKASNYC